VGRTVLPYEPRLVVLYPGENDIARGVSPETVAAGFQRFVATVHGALPRTRILVIGLKPTPARWRFNDQMLGADKLPRLDLFIEDGQHMTRAGYDIWTEIVRPHLK
jgi:lysophospholipase L1-like esterase